VQQDTHASELKKKDSDLAAEQARHAKEVFDLVTRHHASLAGPASAARAAATPIRGSRRAGRARRHQPHAAAIGAAHGAFQSLFRDLEEHHGCGHFDRQHVGGPSGQGNTLRIVNEGPNVVFISVGSGAQTATLPTGTAAATCTAVMPGDTSLSIAPDAVYNISAICRASQTATLTVQVGEGV
jgi:hypothetical protein